MKKKKYFWFFCCFLLLASSALGFSMGKRSDPVGKEEMPVIAEEKITCFETKLRLKKSFRFADMRKSPNETFLRKRSGFRKRISLLCTKAGQNSDFPQKRSF